MNNFFALFPTYAYLEATLKATSHLVLYSKVFAYGEPAAELQSSRKTIFKDFINIKTSSHIKIQGDIFQKSLDFLQNLCSAVFDPQ